MRSRNPRKGPGSPAEWMSHAESDLRLVRLAAEESSVRREQICFHAQQAAEKAIKAVLLSLRMEFPLTHDIEELLEIARTGGMQLPDGVREAGLLTPYAVETRYPGHWLEIAEEDLKEALRIAEVTMKWARTIVSTEKG